MHKALKLVGISALIATIVGCGGKGGDNLIPATFSVDWPQRARNISGLTSALSFRMVIRGAKTNGADFVYVGNRPNTSDPVTSTYSISSSWIASPTTIYFEFYTDKDAAGTYVGGGSSAVIPSTNTISIPSVSIDSAITKVVLPPQSIDPNMSKDLNFTALNSSGKVVPVSFGSAIWFTADESLLTFSNGKANPKGVAGHVNISAKVNGVASDLKLLPIQPALASISLVGGQQIVQNVAANLSAAAITPSGEFVSLYNSELEWISLDPTIISFSNSNATGLKLGTAKVQVAYTNPDGVRLLSEPVTVTVKAATK